LVPDQISTAALAGLLAGRGELPPALVLPELTFGAEDSGVCDLQLALLLLIQRSSSGVNLIQQLTCALYLLQRVQVQLEASKDAAAAREGIFSSVDSREQELLETQFAELVGHISAITNATEALHAAVTVPHLERRAAELSRERDYAEADLPQLRSQLLISDELLAGLGISRAAVTSFLETQATPEPS
jgi:hypothetical protein